MIELTERPIDITKVLSAVSDSTCGAEVLFVGTTRQWTLAASPTSDSLNSPRETSHLVYDCYQEMALAQLHRLAAAASERWPVKKIAIVHRMGRVDPTEASVAVAVSCPHRSEAFESAKWLIDELKHHVPIWKQEHYVQSEAEWIHPTSGSCRCSTTANSESLRRSPPPSTQVTESSQSNDALLGEKQLQQQSQQQ